MEIKFIELKQKHVEAFSAELPDPNTTKVVAYYGALVRAAAKAGWLESPQVDNVDDMNPADVHRLAQAIIAEYARVMDISPS